jgi:hypothetical protein
MTTALTAYHPSPLARKTDPRSPAQEAAQRIVQYAVSGRLSPRHAGRLHRVFDDVEDVIESIRRIAEHGDRMAAGAAACARDMAACEAAVASYQAAAAACETQRAEAEERTRLAAAVVQQEHRVRVLTADVQAEELEIRLAALKAERHAAVATAKPPATAHAGATTAATAHSPGAVRTSASARSAAPSHDASDEALAARLASEAAAILREVQVGLVPTDARHPNHAFAACLYVQAKLDGQDAAGAAAQAQEALIAHLRDGHEFRPAERKAFRGVYDDLKKRLDAAADTRQGATLLSMMKHVGAASAPANNGRGVQ